ncbi:DUF2927 domain-containing protein [Paragemmobacter straminiformis]|uniref:DUF2927 domain-containing protein n=1 Tax=Paragemmobacter straminiformis TaxID=2045119 RepID=A0A842I7K0_9RHOB|nr:DUF2927 domain-containing protein [Gemmobacter straminiformis]MBC2835347.1 DUF2927 domain-containing protein [Gemmobacter straminiformis]
MHKQPHFRALSRTLPFLALFLGACAPMPVAEVTMNRGAPASDAARVVVQGFPGRAGTPPEIGNAEIAQDILDLQFAMESGRPLPVLSRFEGPITIALTGDVPPTAQTDLERVIHRFRAEAGLDVRQAKAGTRASITMDFQPRSALNKVVPSAACFVVPRVSSFKEYLSNRTAPETDWTTVRQREHVAIFAPSDTTPQEVRDCLHEEVAQAMGPLNDLYRLPDSVFNDDNFHTVLTGFDMLVLRAHYDPALRVGMTRSEVAARLPAILSRLNPRGDAIHRAGDTSATPRAWEAAVAAALGARGSQSGRTEAAAQMLRIARAQGWQDGRMAFSLFAYGRTQVRSDFSAALAAFERAGEIYRSLPGGEIQAAHVDMQLAAFAIGQGQPERALDLTRRAMPVVTAAENASLLATLHLIRAQAYAKLGRKAEADAARLDSLVWARYGFGSDAQVRARMDEIAGLAARAVKG